jgi:hypothetical protein
MDILTDIFQNLGLGKLSEDDIKVLIETSDCDRDGKISLDDFRRMLDFNQGIALTAPKVGR